MQWSRVTGDQFNGMVVDICEIINYCNNLSKHNNIFIDYRNYLLICKTQF